MDSCLKDTVNKNAYLNDLGKDVVDLVCDFVRYASITPDEASCLTDLVPLLKKLGCEVHKVVFEDTTNLYARWGKTGLHLCFAGHIDVVPPGPLSLWDFPPFEAHRHEGMLYGRGTSDMKGAVACFISALVETIRKNTLTGSVSILLTSDEEGSGKNGIVRMIPWLEERGEKIHRILIGEPTGNHLGQVVQVGRRGSLVATLNILGIQGHIAYPHQADNPIPRMVRSVQALLDMPLDKGDEHFQPSRLEFSAIETGNSTENVTPSSIKACFGIRFNPHFTAAQLDKKVRDICEAQMESSLYHLTFRLSGNPFITTDVSWIDCVKKSLQKITGKSPTLTTQGGTTDGRFLCKMAPVVEVGLSEDTMHKVNECVSIQEIYSLRETYIEILETFHTA